MSVEGRQLLPKVDLDPLDSHTTRFKDGHLVVASAWSLKGGMVEVEC